MESSKKIKTGELEINVTFDTIIYFLFLYLNYNLMNIFINVEI